MQSIALLAVPLRSMENKKTTIHDIAAVLGITASTVSRALNGHPKISVQTKKRVEKAAAEMNYMPNKLAANLRRGRGNVIGVIVPRINRHFFSHAIAGMESVTNPAGYNLMICQSNEEYVIEKKSIQTLINNRVDGIIMSVSANTSDSSHIQLILDEGIHLVQFDRVSKGLSVNKVVNDNVAGAYDVTKHLIGRGYKRIIHFAGPLQLNVYQDRYQGYLKAMAEFGLQVTDDMIFENVLTRDKGASLIESLIVDRNLPDAVFSASDFSALGAMLAIKKNGIRVPDDIAIAGFANEPFTELTEPGLTSLEQFSEMMGQHAATMLIEDIKQEDQNREPVEVKIAPELIVRGSSGS